MDCRKGSQKQSQQTVQIDLLLSFQLQLTNSQSKCMLLLIVVFPPLLKFTTDQHFAFSIAQIH